MSLGDLLSIGRALGKVPARPVAYRDVGGWAPDFGSPRPPGGDRGAPPSAGEGVDLSAAAAARRQAGPPAEACPASGMVIEEGVVASGVYAGPKPVANRRGRDRPAGRLVQGELALSAVRVVRNDLFADDLELIPRPGASVGRMTLRPDRRRLAAARGGWRGWLAHWRQWLRGGVR